MNTNQKPLKRPTVDDGKVKMYMTDDENSFMYKPMDVNNNRFFGTVSKMTTLSNQLDQERTNYNMPFQAYYKAQNELMAVPQCFDRCIQDLTMAALSSDEKNCVRECSMKKMASREDLAMLGTQRMSRLNVKQRRDYLV